MKARHHHHSRRSLSSAAHVGQPHVANDSSASMRWIWDSFGGVLQAASSVSLSDSSTSQSSDPPLFYKRFTFPSELSPGHEELLAVVLPPGPESRDLYANPVSCGPACLQKAGKHLQRHVRRSENLIFETWLEAEGHGNRGSCSRCDMRGQDPVSVTFSAGSGKWRPTGSPLMWNHKKKHWYLNGLKLKEGWMVARVRICCRPEHWDLSTLLRLHMRLSLPVEMVYGDFLTTSFALVPSPTKDDSPTEAEEGATTVSH